MGWNPFTTSTPALAAERTKNRLSGHGTVIYRGTPRDLDALATDYSANPSIWKQMLHSGFVSPFRRAVQSPAAFGSAFGKATQSTLSFLFSEIPIPGLNVLLENACNKACDKLREKSHGGRLNAYGINPEEKIKFKLKEIGKEVENFDRYRWKVKHAMEQFNIVVQEADKMESAPCDKWVRVLVKWKYLSKRIGKLRSSVETVKAVCEETDAWLTQVEAEFQKVHDRMKPIMDADVEKLKNFAGAHETCSEEFCMYKDKRWTDSKSVPTSDTANFLIKSASAISDTVSTSPTDYM
ncbi:MAG: hypothetical protein PHP23_11095 [Desulfobacterales bacterium]|nr:hypothetical protein [Desulfobacterales bacterium]MDD4071614.1 hypothetical protein [Desulfobacterales bacterium]MDD4392651.1 hypothetical protein [Desulfobacterales bacterium]